MFSVGFFVQYGFYSTIRPCFARPTEIERAVREAAVDADMAAGTWQAAAAATATVLGGSRWQSKENA